MGEAFLDYKKGGSGLDINGIIEDYYVYAGKKVSAGDFVEFVNGVASKTYIGTSEETKIGSSQNSTPIKAVTLSENKIFIAHQHWTTSGTYYLRGIVCIIDGISITYGADTTLLTSTSNSFADIACSTLDENRVFIAHSGLSSNYLRALVCTISGTTITAGTDTDLSTNSGSGYSVMTQLIDTDKIFITHCWSNGYGASYTICTISGTVITKEATNTISSGANQTQYSVINIILLENKDLFIIYSGTVSSNYYLCGNVCSISGTTVTKGTETQLSNIAWSSYNISSALLENNNIFIAHSNANSNSSLYGLVCKISGTTITAGTSTQLSTATNSGILKSSISIKGNKVLIIYSASLILYGMICTINGNTIVTGTAVELGTGSYNRYSISLIEMPSENIFIAHGGGTEVYLYGQIISIDEENNIPTNQITITDYETQVRPATSSPCNGVAKSSGEGGGSSGHKDMVSVYVPDVPTYIEFASNPAPTTWTNSADYLSATASNEYGEWSISAETPSIYDISYCPSKAFDDADNSAYMTNSWNDILDKVYLYLNCPEGVSLNPSTATIYHGNCGNSSYNLSKLQAYNGAEWVELATLTSSASTVKTDTFNLSEKEYYTAFRVEVTPGVQGNRSTVYNFKITSGTIKIE